MVFGRVASGRESAGNHDTRWRRLKFVYRIQQRSVSHRKAQNTEPLLTAESRSEYGVSCRRILIEIFHRSVARTVSVAGVIED